MIETFLAVGDFVDLIDRVTATGVDVPWFAGGRIISFDGFGNAKVQDNDGWWSWFTKANLIKREL